MIILRRSPTRFDQSGNVPFARMIAQAQPAHAKTPVKRPRAAAQRAPIVFAHFKLVRHFGFDSQTLLCQWNSPLL
jgi:hypothetical protein